ncbi:MAG: PEP-CTERM sorting domain-containing protein [Phycisphaerae bacterium]|nr:PEP-CTERM sorting domain-containing protein [Phycisphaerae bacterium]
MRRSLNRKGSIIVLIAFILGFACEFAPAAVDFDSTNYYTAIAGNKFQANRRVTINGSVAGKELARIGISSTVTGDVFSDNRLLIRRRATLGGISYANGYLRYGSDVESGSVIGQNNVKISHNNFINGYLSYAGKADISPTASIANSLPAILPSRAFVDHEMPVFGPQRSKKSTMTIDENTHLAPGNYDNIRAKRYSVIYLTAGTYNFGDFILNRHAKIVADSSLGDINIVVNGKYRSYRHVILDNIGENDVDIIASGNIRIGKKNDYEANLLSGNNLNVNRDSIINGFTYSEHNTLFQRNVELNFQPAGAGSELPPAVPEPASILLLGSAGMFLARKRKP